MIAHDITIVFKGGAKHTIEATDDEMKSIVQDWSDYLANPAKKPTSDLRFANGSGRQMLVWENVAGVFQLRR